MAQTTVKQLASETGIPVERLVSRLAEAGVEARSAEDHISDEDKLKLLSHLRNAESARSGGKLGAKPLLKEGDLLGVGQGSELQPVEARKHVGHPRRP